ncbi:MAG: flagellar export chaperone FlgN [Phycisphaerales bacterium JB039]
MSDTSPMPDAPSIDQLWGVLDEMAERAEELLGLIREQQDAVRRMDAGAIREATQRQARVAERLRQLESARAALAGAQPLTQLAESMAPAARQRALRLVGRLGEAGRAIARDSAVVSACAGAMLGHIDGLMRAVARELSHTGAYGPRGVIGAGAPIVSGIDITR